jgi:hypothetical protein
MPVGRVPRSHRREHDSPLSGSIFWAVKPAGINPDARNANIFHPRSCHRTQQSVTCCDLSPVAAHYTLRPDERRSSSPPASERQQYENLSARKTVCHTPETPRPAVDDMDSSGSRSLTAPGDSTRCGLCFPSGNADGTESCRSGKSEFPLLISFDAGAGKRHRLYFIADILSIAALSSLSETWPS